MAQEFTNEQLTKKLERKEYLKEYRNQNKEKIFENNKEYYQENKEKINEKLNCECGGKYTKTNKAKHLQTIKHMKFLNKK